MKKILIGSVVVIGVVTVAGAVAVNYLLDSDTIAQELQKEAKTRFNRDLKFAGPIDIKLFPKIAIELPATSLSFVGSEKSQVTLKSASIGVAVLPLLTGDVKLDAVKIDGLKGSLNLNRLKATMDAKQKATDTVQSATSSSASSSPLSFIKDFSVQSIDVFDSALTLYGVQAKKAYELKNVNLSMGSLAMKGETSVRFSADFAEKSQALAGHVSLDSKLIYDVKSMAASLEKMTAGLEFKQKEAATKLQLTAPKVMYVQGELLVDSLALRLTAPNNTDVEASMKVASSLSMSRWMVDALKGTAKTTVANRLLTVPFAGKMHVQTTGETVAMSLTGELENSPWSVQLQSIGFSKPGVTGQVSLDEFVLDSWLANKTSAKVAFVNGYWVTNAWAAPATDLSVLGMLDANVSLNVGKIRYQGLDVSQFGGKVALQNGVLTLQNWQALLAGGQMKANATLNQSAYWNLNAQTSKLNTETLAQGLGIRSMLEGTASATVNVKGSGLDSVAIKKTMNGTVSAKVDNAVLRGLSLEKVASAVREKNVAGLIANKEDVTKLQALQMKATVKNGEVYVTSLTGKSSVAEVSGQAKIGLLNESLSGKVTAKLATSANGRRVTVPINLGGTVTDPVYQFDVGGAVKSQLQEELKNSDLLLKGLNKLFKH